MKKKKKSASPSSSKKPKNLFRVSNMVMKNFVGGVSEEEREGIVEDPTDIVDLIVQKTGILLQVAQEEARHEKRQTFPEHIKKRFWNGIRVVVVRSVNDP